jgi:hypothetical protein
MSLHLRSDTDPFSSAVLISESPNPSWDPGSMPSWNLTMQCLQWDEDYHPCTFPYFGLSGYGPNAEHCNTLFSQAFPDTYQAVQVLFLVCNSILLLLYGSRMLLCLVDTGLLPSALAPLQTRLEDPRFRRPPKSNTHTRKGSAPPPSSSSSRPAVNVYDYCNAFMLLASLLQVVLSCDLEGWSDRIPYKLHVTLGVMSQNIAVMTGIPITVNWMNLIHVWTDPFKK